MLFNSISFAIFLPIVFFSVLVCFPKQIPFAEYHAFGCELFLLCLLGLAVSVPAHVFHSPGLRFWIEN